MSRRPSQLSNSLRSFTLGQESSEPVLPLVRVLEEEYAALHPHPDPTDPEPPAPSVTLAADDIADVWGLAHALAGPWPALRELIVRDRPDLDYGLRTVSVHVHAADLPDHTSARDAVAARLNALLKEPQLSCEPALSSALEMIRKHDDGSFDGLGFEQRNRILIECALSPFIRTMPSGRATN